MSIEQEFGLVLATSPFFFGPRSSFNDVVITHATKPHLRHQESPMPFGCGHLLAKAIRGSDHMAAR